MRLLSFIQTALLLSVLGSGVAAGSDASSDLFPTVREPDWVGLRLTVLPQSKALQHYGYQELYRDTDPDFAPLPYAAYAGRTARVLRIEQGHGPNGEVLDEADLQFEDNKEVIHGDIDHGCMEDVAPTADLEAAKKQYAGKTLWLASDHLNTYDAEKDRSDSPASTALKQAFKQIKIKQYSPVRVLDVVPGWYASAPIRFVVQDEAGEAGYVDVHMSDTNVPESLQAKARFDDVFLESDPRKTYPWPAKIWGAIEAKQVFAGMTTQQVRLSWGVPKEIRTSSQDHTEQWLYASNYSLTMQNDTLKKIVTVTNLQRSGREPAGNP